MTAVATYAGRRKERRNNRILISKLKAQNVDNRPKIYISIKNFNHGRYGFQLLNYLASAKYQVVLYDSHHFLLNLHSYDRLIFNINGLRVTDKIEDEIFERDMVFLLNTDKPHDMASNIKVFKLSLDYFNNLGKSGEIMFPYYVHPVMHEQVTKMDTINISKTAGLLFYGSYIDINSVYVERVFNKMPRTVVFDLLKKSRLDISYPNSYEELLECLQKNNHNSFYIIDESKFRIPADSWLEVISKFHFFLATPGQMPVSHNLIEAMAVGTTPVLQYAELLSPALEHGNNCLVFKDQDDLEAVINEAIHMSPEKKEEMNEATRKYFVTYIHPTSFIEQLSSLPAKSQTIYFNAEEFSFNYIQLN